MSDLSALEQSFALPSAAMLAPLDEPPPPACADLEPHEVDFRRLTGAHEIARILHLREEIRLPASALGDQGFLLREKKETRSAWWARSSATASTSAPSATCR